MNVSLKSKGFLKKERKRKESFYIRYIVNSRQLNTQLSMVGNLIKQKRIRERKEGQNTSSAPRLSLK